MASAAKQLRYHHGGATYGDLAYDLELELRERELRHAGERPRMREEALPRPQVRTVPQVQVRPRQAVSPLAVLGFLIAAALAAMMIVCYVELTVISSEVVSLRGELSRLETENVTLVASYEQMFDLATVKEAAESAGMAKPGSGQVYYMDLSGGDSAVVYQRQEPGLLSRLVASLNHGVYAVVEYFD